MEINGRPPIAGLTNTPAQVTADQNDYNPGQGNVQRWSTDASRNITGMLAGVSSEIRYIVNVGSFNIVIKNASGSSAAANRFLTSTGADVTLAAAGACTAIYDGTTANWRIF